MENYNFLHHRNAVKGKKKDYSAGYSYNRQPSGYSYNRQPSGYKETSAYGKNYFQYENLNLDQKHYSNGVLSTSLK